MNKPASELIALADQLKTYIWQPIETRIYPTKLMLKIDTALRTAANHASERAGSMAGWTDNKLAAWARNWHWQDTADDKPVDPSIYFRDMRMLKAFVTALATPPAQPVSERYRLSYYGDFTPITVRGSSSETHGKPDGVVRSRPSDCVNPMQCGWHHVCTEPEINMWLCSQPDCDHMVRAQTALHSPKIAAADDDTGTCIACNTAFVEGDMVYPDASGGSIHASCCGPERGSYVNADGEPLKDGDPLPTPQRWTSAAAETSTGDQELDIARAENADNVRMLDAIADFVGCPHNEELTVDHVRRHCAKLGTPGDVLAMKEACKRVATDVATRCANDLVTPPNIRGLGPDNYSLSYGNHVALEIAAAIDSIDVKAEAKSQEPEAVAWRFCVKSEPGAWSYSAKQPIQHSLLDIEPLFAHPTTKPEAPAVSVDAIKAALCCPDGCCEPKACGAGKHPDEIAQATAIAALIAGER